MSGILVRRVAILGAGTTGGALAAHLTNLGFSVTLMDTTLAGAASAIEHVRPSLLVPERAVEIRTISLDEGIPTLGEADWIVEAIPERLETKQALYRRITPYVRPDAVVSTCSGSLPVSELIEGLDEGFASRFLAVYFALPLAEHRLAELRPGLDPGLGREFKQFLTDEVARRVIVMGDGPGVAARYGLWCLLLGANVAEKLRLDVEEVEALTGSFLRQTGSGVFGALDRVGLGEMRNVAENLRARLPNDRGARFLLLPNTMTDLLARGWSGDKAGRGYFRREGREHLALNLMTMAYRQPRETTLSGLLTGGHLPTADRLKAALGGRDEVGEFLREFLVTSLQYAEYLREAMGLSVLDFDHTLEWGFGWEKGPFALLDDLGTGAFRYYQNNATWTPEGYVAIPKEDAPGLTRSSLVDRGEGYAIRDLGDGIQAVALSIGPLTPSRVVALMRLLGDGKHQRFVLTAEDGDWPGLDLEFVLTSLRNDVPALDAYLANMQTLSETIEGCLAVAAVGGRCVGPALAMALSCAGIVASAEATVGFDEARLGLVPTARGAAILRSLHGSSSRKVGEIAITLTEGTVFSNPDLARAAGLLRATDVTEYLPDRLVTRAKELTRVVSAQPLAPFPPIEGPLVGMIDRGLAERRNRGSLTDYDVTVGHKIRQLMARTMDYEECLDLERKESIELGGKALTQARLRHVLDTGKALRN